MSKRKQKINLTKIRAALSEACFNPATPGPFKVILETMGDNPTYLENRAIELIKDFQLGDMTGRDNTDKLTKAIGLLAVAKVLRSIDLPPEVDK